MLFSYKTTVIRAIYPLLGRTYTRCQKFFPILDIHKSPPFNKGVNYKELLLKSPFDQGGFRGI
jgi:hypothetical protein